MSLKNLQAKIGVNPDGGTLRAAMNYYNLTPHRAAHFFAQTAHESGDFKAFSENLNYSAKGLRGVFGKYFPTDIIAAQYERQPEKIANGDEASGDGFRFRGRGALQLTGRSNYQAFADATGRPEVMQTPDLVATDLALESAMYFVEKNKLWVICDQGITDAAILSLTKKNNGGTLGLADRSEKTKKYAGWLA